MAMAGTSVGNGLVPSIGAPPSAPSDDGERDNRILTQLQGIAGDLEKIAKEREGLRKTIEIRWIEDLQQYHGKYPDADLKRMRDQGISQLFINMTRPKTDAMAARLNDLLFPTDEKNWGIKPTPVPTLTKQADEAATRTAQKEQQAKMAEQQAAQAPQNAQLQQAAQARMAELEQAKIAEGQLRAVIAEAAKRAELMEGEIDDQLRESLYQAIMRDMIEDACKIGTGVVKGPVTGDRLRKGWKETTDPKTGKKSFSLNMSDGQQPAMRYVDPWEFFPDMSVAKVQDGMGVFERHLMSSVQLRALKDLPGFELGALSRLLKSKPIDNVPSYITSLRSIRGDNVTPPTGMYHVWEYSGPLEAVQMESLRAAFDEGDGERQEIDPLEADLNAVVWFCDGEILKFAIYPYDSGECMYSVYNLSKDEHSIFGEGIPAMMRDPQSSLNAGWRGMMDNAAIASGPQIVVAREKVAPMDGIYRLAPRKMWEIVEPWTSAHPPFWNFDVPMHQVEMANIVVMSERLIDEVTSMPKIAQGEQGSQVTKTAGGMSLLMNSANVVFRRIVRNFDDDVTVPNLRRFYDWNMQHSKREEIKGDFNVDARGSSVLLAREIQGQNLMQIALHLGPHPVFGPMLKNRAVLRKLLQAQMVSADELMLTDDDIDSILMKAAAVQQESAERQQKFQEWQMTKDFDLREREVEQRAQDTAAKVAMANQANQTKLQVENRRQQGDMEEATTRANTALDQTESAERIAAADRAQADRALAVEVAVTDKIGPTAGGKF